ncbi:hypothetical protein [Streptomyces sp. MMG1121]|uniref:hypothetical protein n=1 Tax=Streptomyces sp. MMG1121 TaxID=1415544 RepID=UPI0006ADFA87|nr:hypothetical protein [Streptomyces sp. MMG1121]KOV58616.1 hypothetical protein ADK64_35800 [Streptomyces sp. MMG1121]
MKSQPCSRSHTQESRAVAGSVLCAACMTGVRHSLLALPGLHQECLHQVSPTGRRTNPTKVSGSRSRDHLDISVLDARHNILTILESWSGMVVEKLGTNAPPRTVLSLARFLTLHLDWLAGQPPAVDFADEIEALVVELRRTIDPEPNDLHTLIRHCVVDNCPGTISAFPQRGAGAGSSITCSSGHSWEVCEWLSLRKLMERQRKGVSA